MSSMTLTPPPYRLAPDVVLVPIPDGSARLLDLQGQSFALSEVAAHMLNDILDLGPAGAAARVAGRWGVDVERVRADLDAFLADLLRQGLLAPAGQAAPRPKLRHKLAEMFLSTLVRLTRRLRPTLAGKATGLLTAANLSARWLGWARTVRLWQRLFPKPARPLEGPAAAEALRTVDAAVRQAVAGSALSHACKERGLASWALARRAGLDPRLIVGVALFPFQAHCWAQLGETPLGDTPERCAEYQPVWTCE